MSNEVYGFAEFVEAVPSSEIITQKLQESAGLGIALIQSAELYNFTSDQMPKPKSIIFMVSDRPGSNNATYLVDFEDYAPDAQIGLPNKGLERLNLLVNTIESLFADHRANRVCIAITDSSQIEESKMISRKSLRKVLLSDFEKIAPPCCLYDIRNETDEV